MGQAFDDVVNAAAADPQKFWEVAGQDVSWSHQRRF